MICVPVIAKDRTLGALQAINSQRDPFEQDDMLILHALANQVAVAIENARLHEASITDGLTGLYHHNYFIKRLEEEIDRASRYQHSLTLAMLDIDHFKQVNDRHGHLAGDQVLEKFALVIKDNIRLSDIAGRYGGEEFGVILPYTSFEDGMIIGERFRKAVEQLDIPAIPITVSVGLAFWAGGTRNCFAARLIEEADKALYTAKHNGRNRVESRIVE
jgi:diguanylate cyclase (GGDEF)-like protein